MAIYNNPIESIQEIASVKGTKLMFSYSEGMDLTGLNYNEYNVVDCPLDKQVEVKLQLGGNEYAFGVHINTVSEADEEVGETKYVDITGCM